MTRLLDPRYGRKYMEYLAGNDGAYQGLKMVQSSRASMEMIAPWNVVEYCKPLEDGRA